ncbi:MAG TPA: PAS domain S-box protein [Syntrophales bacterium]|nr:PAS domain S-box protein [Syntrophales bacterium]HQI35250.1 PAS domain S-box protein [Syntrophales bacterium]
MNQHEKKGRGDRDLFAVLAGLSGDAVYLLVGGRMAYVNRRFLELFRIGAERVQAPDFDFMELVAPESRALVAGRHVPGGGMEEASTFAFTALTADGDRIGVEASVSSLDIAGEATVCGVIRDLTEHRSLEASLRGMEERFQKTFRASPAPAIISTVAEGRYIAVNDRWCEMMGYRREELLGKTAAELNIWADMEERAALMAKYLDRGSLRDEKVHLRTKNGEIREVLCSTEIIGQEDAPAVILSQFWDITETVRREAALRESEERYRTILEEMEEGYHEVDLKGNFTFVNDSFCRIFGYGREEIIGHNYRRFAASAETAETVYEAYNEMFRTGKPVKRFEWEIATKNGQVRTIEFSASLIRDAAGHRRGFRGVVRDITERKDREEQYRTIADATQTGIYIVQDGRIVFINPHIPAYSGYEARAMMGTRIIEYVHPEDREAVRENARKMLTGERNIPYEYRIVTKQGQIRWLMEKVTPVSYRGRAAVLGNTMDITAQKEAEQKRQNLEFLLLQAQKMEAVGTLAGGIAHDFNNLLMGIQGYVSLILLDLKPGHPHYERLRAVEQQVQSGAELTKQLLGFARGGRYEIKATDINALVRKTVAVFGRTKKELRIFEKYDPELCSVEADQGQMEQVILNLLVNAWQAMPGGGDLYLQTANVRLDEAYAAPYDLQAGNYVQISVTDTGVGMDEQTRRRIFEPFFTTKEMGRGTGLGLSSAYGIVRGHGGIITVYSEVGHGTTFNIYLPASELPPVGSSAESSGEMVPGRETILVVDDEEIITEVTAGMLAQLGYRVMTAGSGKEALELYERHRDEIDLVVMDMIMPGMSGGETIERLLALNPEVPVILSSGYSLNGMAKEVLAKGARAFLQKPFRMDALSRKIQEILGRK